MINARLNLVSVEIERNLGGSPAFTMPDRSLRPLLNAILVAQKC